MKKCFSVLFAACVVAVLFSCHQSDVVVDMGTRVLHPSSVYALDINSAGYGVTRLEGPSAEDDIFLARIKNNRLRYNRHALPEASGAGQAEQPGQEEGRSLMGVDITETGETILRYERRWQVTPPQGDTLSRSRMSSFAEPKVGDKRDFFVDISPATNDFTVKTATLKAISDYCKVWVVDGYYSESMKLEELAAQFDKIYPIETNILGYEYGGGPGGDGGMDGDPKIQILLFDIDGDQNRGFGGVTYGYFYPGDEFTRGKTYPCSNEAEIFYIDSLALATNPTAIYSTLIHEFNHMINFNLKVLVGDDYTGWNTEVWYTEMLSMLAEDTIGPLVGIPVGERGHVTNDRIPSWLSRYADLSVMYWPNAAGESLYYYSSNYAFGAYLVRNFGGPALFSAIAKSTTAGRGSIDGFLRLFNGRDVDTAYAMSRFSEALVYSGTRVPEGTLTFDKTVTDIIGSTPYTFEGFDIWSATGPLIRDYKKISEYTLPNNTVQLYTDSGWAEEVRTTGGRLEIKLLNVDSDAEYYIMTRKPK